VTIDIRLQLRDGLRKVESYLVDFLKVMAARAEQEISWSCQDTNIFTNKTYQVESLDVILRYGVCPGSGEATRSYCRGP
jgi:hypothetical protein